MILKQLTRQLLSVPSLPTLVCSRSGATAADLLELATQNAAEMPENKHQDKRLVDKVRVLARAGSGGAGCDSLWSSNRKGKFKPPDGGNGGCGGSVIVRASPALKDLRGIRFLQKAGHGGHGRPQKKTGIHGTSKVIEVPLGTVVSRRRGAQAEDSDKHAASHDISLHAPSLDNDTEEVLADLWTAGASVVAARGGQGGRGNAAFGSRQNRPALRDRELGHPGEEVLLQLELKLLADVGFVGAPNAGKSTLLRALSRARPMVGSYAFTTLEPQLGVVSSEDMRLLVADIPGLIPGASRNRGLGHAFLRHIERTRVLAYVLDISAGRHGRDGLQAAQQLKMLQEELGAYSGRLLEKPALVVANKMDLLGGAEHEEVVKDLESSTELRVLTISAQAGEGVDAVREALLQQMHIKSTPAA